MFLWEGEGKSKKIIIIGYIKVTKISPKNKLYHKLIKLYQYFMCKLATFAQS